MNNFLANILKNTNEVHTVNKIFYALLEDKVITDALKKSGADIAELKNLVRSEISEEEALLPPAVPTADGRPMMTVTMREIIKKIEETRCPVNEATSIDVFFTLADMEGETDISDIISEAGGNIFDAVTVLVEKIERSMPPIPFPLLLGIPAMMPHSARTSSAPNEDESSEWEESITDYPFLTDMIEEAKSYTLPFIGREDIIERTIMILNRKTKHNVIHLGDPGVGKTACTIGLARKIINGEVPSVLKNAKVVSLDMGSLMAGTKYRGEMEEKVSNMLTFLKSQKDTVILYIDEVHQIVGAGACGDSTVDIANLLKPLLASADCNIRVFGATTKDEYRKCIEKDKALARRFQTVAVNEPTEAEATEILMGLKKAFEKYHGVAFSKEAIKASVELSAKYINDKFLPDKAIDVIDETGSRLSIAGIKKVSKKDIQDTVAKIAKIPSENVSENETSRLSRLGSALGEKVYGQDEAIKRVVAAIQMSKAGLNEENKPIASFLFVGPTGVGKTEIARTLAATMDIPLVRFDMSEYKDETAVNKFIGASAGYVGYEDGGLLVNAIKDKPHSVLLLDEIEKAHPAVFDTLLQVMDNATLTDNKGRVADFKNVVIIMTSNAGARNISRTSIGFGEKAAINVSAMSDAVKSTFTPEFRNRLTSVVEFNSMSPDMAISIAKKQLESLSNKLAAKKVKLSYGKDVLNKIVDDAKATDMGGREIIRVVDGKIKPLFVSELLFGELLNGGYATLSIDENGDYKIAVKSTSRKKPA